MSTTVLTQLWGATLDLTERCNLRCVYCYHQEKTERDLSVDAGMQAIDFVLRHSGQNVRIGFVGGETLLRFDVIEELVEYAQKNAKSQRKRLLFALTTNGTLLDDRIIAFCEDHRIFIVLSADGARRSHDMHRITPSGEGSFDLVEKAIDRMVEYQGPWQVNTVITPKTAPLLYENVMFLVDRGCRSLEQAIDYSAEWTERDFAALAVNYEKVAELWMEEILRDRPLEIKFITRMIKQRLSPHIAPCPAGHDRIGISVEGKIYPCHRFTQMRRRDLWCIGDIHKGMDMRKSEELTGFRICNMEECKDCRLMLFCPNGCIAVSYATADDIHGFVPDVCIHTKLVIPIVIRAAKRLLEKDSSYLMKLIAGEIFGVWNYGKREKCGATFGEGGLSMEGGDLDGEG